MNNRSPYTYIWFATTPRQQQLFSVYKSCETLESLLFLSARPRSPPVACTAVVVSTDRPSPLPQSDMEPRESLGVEGDSGILVPSPRSDAVTHDMEELSLQPTQSLPPLRDRKNGEWARSVVPSGQSFAPKLLFPPHPLSCRNGLTLRK